MGRRRLLATLVLALAGCGPTPPQAPGPEAHQLNTALSTFSSACGRAATIKEFSKSAHDLTIVEHQAQAEVPTLVRIYKRNPNWVFQSKTTAQLVQMSTKFLDECGLHAAADQLRRESSSR